MEEAIFGLFAVEQENGDEVLECTEFDGEEYVEEQEQEEYQEEEEEEEEEEEGQQCEESAYYVDFNGDANVETNNDVDVDVDVEVDIDFNKQPNRPPQKPNEGTSVAAPVLTTDPMNIVCSFCHANCMTRTRTHPDAITIAFIILLIFIFWPLCWLPLVIPGCKTTVHYCSSCNQEFGSCNACSS